MPINNSENQLGPQALQIVLDHFKEQDRQFYEQYEALVGNIRAGLTAILGGLLILGADQILSVHLDRDSLVEVAWHHYENFSD